MQTKVVEIKSGGGLAGNGAIREAADIIKAGGLVAFPTETVYGLGADALQPQAAKKIYEAKGRPSDNPLIIHIAALDALDQIAVDIPKPAWALAERFWPGPLTMILKKAGCVPFETTGGLDTAAVRMPDHRIALALIRESGGYIAAPSANVSGRPSPTSAAHVAEDLGGRIPLILDGGEVGIGIESTIIDFTEDIPTVLRPGYITLEMAKSVLGEVRMDAGVIAENSMQKPKAPGMKYRHYAPEADLVIVEGGQDAVVEAVNRKVAALAAAGKKAGILCTDETRGRYLGGEAISVGSCGDAESAARNLFAVLREFDHRKVDVVYAESFCTDGIGQAVMNRLRKAAGQKVWKVETGGNL